eukprot:gene38108-43169_t
MSIYNPSAAFRGKACGTGPTSQPDDYVQNSPELASSD